MKKSVGNTIRLGIFVSIGFLLLVAGIYFVGVRQHLFSSTFRLNCIFSNINGLQVGSNVRLCGINVGIITEIEQLTDTTVRVDMEIEEKSRRFIKQNALAVVSSDGLVGDKIVSINAGKPGSKMVGDDAFLETIPAVSTDEILGNMKTVGANAVRITDELAFIMETVGDGEGIIGKMFFDSSFAEVIEGALVNLKDGAGGFKQNMDAAGHSLLLKGYLKKKEKAKKRAEAKRKQGD